MVIMDELFQVYTARVEHVLNYFFVIKKPKILLDEYKTYTNSDHY